MDNKKQNEAIIDLKSNPLKRNCPSNMSFAELREELERQLETMKDIAIADKNVKVWAIGNEISLEVPEIGDFPMTDICHAHISQNLNIPKKYYDRMRLQEPDLLVENINTWLQKSNNINIIRTMDEKAYAYVSGGYGFYDNYDFLVAIADAVFQMGGVFYQIYLDDKQMVLKACRQDMERELPIQEKGTVFPAIFFENSGCRYRKLTVSPTLIFVNCWNGLIGENIIEQIHRSYHQKLEGILSQETIRTENKAFWLKIRDVIKATFDNEQYDKWMKQITTASKYELNEPTKVLEGIVVKCEIPETQKNMVFDYFSKQGDATQFGAIQALTYYAHTQDNVEREVSIERTASSLLGMDGHKFEKAMITIVPEQIVEAETE